MPAPMIDKRGALKMLQEGRTVKEIAKVFGTKEQSVRRHKRNFILAGELEGSIQKHTPQTPATVPRTVLGTRKADYFMDLDDGVKALISMAELASQVPALKEEYHNLSDEAYTRRCHLKAGMGSLLEAIS